MRNIHGAFIGLLAIVATVTTVLGLSTGTVHAAPVGSIETITIPADIAHTVGLTTCQDNMPVFIDVATGTIYGDQDSNGVLDGEDCLWN